MPEFQTFKQRRQRSRNVSQNNKIVCKYDRQISQLVEPEMQTHQASFTIDIDSRSEPKKTIDVNGNSHIVSLPTHNEGTSAHGRALSSKKSPELSNQRDNEGNNTKSSGENKSDCSIISAFSPRLAEVHETQDSNGSDTPCGFNQCDTASKLSSVDPVSRTMSCDLQHCNEASQKPAVPSSSNVNHNSTVPDISQPWSGLRSSSCQRRPSGFQRRPTNPVNPGGNTMQRDFSKRQDVSAHFKTGPNKKKQISSQTLNHFPAAPYFNIPEHHVFHPNAYSYSSQVPNHSYNSQVPHHSYSSHVPQLNLSEHQRLSMWNSFGCVPHSPFPLQHAYGAYQSERQFQGRDYGTATKEKFTRISNQDQPGKTNRFQNRPRSRKYNSEERPEMNQTQFAKDKDVDHCKSICLSDQGNKEIAGDLRYSDNANILLTESMKHTLASSKDGKNIGNQVTRYTEHGTMNPQSERNRVADMELRYRKVPQLESNNSDARRIDSQTVQLQTPSNDLYTLREYPNAYRSHQTVDRNDSAVKVYRPPNFGKAGTGWCHNELIDAQAKPNVSPCYGVEQTSAMRNHAVFTREKAECDNISENRDSSARTNTYSNLQTLPPHFNPSVHPLLVFQNGHGVGQDHRWLRQTTQKPPLSDYTSAPPFTALKANITDSCGKSAECNSERIYANEHQVSLNAIAPTSTVKAAASNSTSYAGNPVCISKKGSSNSINPVCINSLNNEAHSLNPGNVELTIDEEIEEEMKRAQTMSIPVKINSETCSSLNSRLNPNADEFAPPLTDCNGDKFTMIKQRGVCYFHRDTENAVVGHPEPNNSYEHEVADVLISTPASFFKNYSTNNHVIPKERESKFLPIHHQQQLEYYGSGHPLYNGYRTALSDAGCNVPGMMYNRGTYLSAPHIPEHMPESTQCASNQMYPADNYFIMNNGYFNEKCSPFFSSAQSQANHSHAFPSPEVNFHAQSPYSNSGYACSFVPMYVSPSPVAAPMMSFPGTEYCSVLIPTPVAPGVPFTVPVQTHIPSQTQLSVYSEPEQMPLTSSTQNYSFQAPVFNLQAYYEATQNNSTMHSTNTPDQPILDTDLPHAVITQNIGSFANNWETKSGPNIHHETTQNANNDSTHCTETYQVQLNNYSVTSNNHQSSRKVNIDVACGNTLEGVPSNGNSPEGVPSNGNSPEGVPTNGNTLEGVPANGNTLEGVPASNVHAPTRANDIRNTPEFQECRILLDRLRNGEVTFEHVRENVSSESENQRRRIEEWLRLAFGIIDRSGNRLSTDDMVSVMLLPSLRRNFSVDR